MNNKRLKHGILSVTVTAVVLVAVILFNIVFSLLASKFLWVIDTTPNDLVVISDYSKELIEGIDGEENDITIYFLADPDQLENYELTGHKQGEGNSTWGMSYIYNLAKLFEKEYSFISVGLLDAEDDADYIRENYTMSIGASLGPLHIIMENRVNGLTTYRTMQRDEFFSFGSNSIFFRGDDKFTSTLLSLSGENPVAYFIEGHGEDVGPSGDLENFGKAEALAELFREAGFVIEKIDLSKRDFPSDRDDALYGRAGVAVLFGTKSDFQVSKDVNEVTRLRKYLNRKSHSLMVFMDPETPETPNLDEYLEDYWGIGFENSVVKVDTTDPVESGALSEDGYRYYGRYETASSSPGSALTSSFSSLPDMPNAFFGKSCTIHMNPKWNHDKDFTTLMEGMTSYKVGAAFLAPTLSAALYDDDGDGIFDDRYKVFDADLHEVYRASYEDKMREEIEDEFYDRYYQKEYDAYRKELEKEDLSDDEIAQKCDDYAKSIVKSKIDAYLTEQLMMAQATPSAVMTLTHASWMYQQGESVASYALACASTDFASKEAIENASFSNRDTLYTAIYLFGKNVLPFDIDIIQVESPSSLAIDDSSSTLWFVILAGVIPACVIAAGITVTVKRRRHN